mmetsp:Transcript_10860/g.13405  ORF Transcript_10860/g.13405 Transcript_10860/m.13405 type:complete len:89 (-) Transcript_10860:36-302(-)
MRDHTAISSFRALCRFLRTAPPSHINSKLMYNIKQAFRIRRRETKPQLIQQHINDANQLLQVLPKLHPILVDVRSKGENITTNQEAKQ